MKPLVAFSFAAVLLTAAAPHVRSQFPVSAPPFQQLQAIKAKNQELLDKQTATLQKLDELELQAQQVKFLGKRS